MPKGAAGGKGNRSSRQGYTRRSRKRGTIGENGSFVNVVEKRGVFVDDEMAPINCAMSKREKHGCRRPLVEKRVGERLGRIMPRNGSTIDTLTRPIQTPIGSGSEKSFAAEQRPAFRKTCLAGSPCGQPKKGARSVREEKRKKSIIFAVQERRCSRPGDGLLRCTAHRGSAEGGNRSLGGEARRRSRTRLTSPGGEGR